MGDSNYFGSLDANDPSEDLGFDAVYDFDGGNGNYGGNDGNDNWFSGDNNPWRNRVRSIPMTEDGLDFKLVELDPDMPMPRAGGSDNIAVDLFGEAIFYTGKDHNGDDYLDSIHHDEFSGHKYAVPRDEDPANPEAFPRLAGETAGDYDHNHGVMNNDLYDVIDNFDDDDMDLDDDRRAA